MARSNRERCRAQVRVPPGRPSGQAGQQLEASRVGGQQVVGPAQHVGRVGAQRVEQLPDAGADQAGRRRGRDRRPPRGLSREGPQELVFLLVQEQRAGQGIDHGRAGPGLLAAFQARVVVDGHPRPGWPVPRAAARACDASRGRPAGPRRRAARRPAWSAGTGQARSARWSWTQSLPAPRSRETLWGALSHPRTAHPGRSRPAAGGSGAAGWIRQEAFRTGSGEDPLTSSPA